MATTKTQPGQALRGLRKKAGLTLADVADIADTAPAYLSKVESGALEPSESYFWRIASSITAAMVGA
jgi:transcriptional regulator with XRE-family HTH domain